MTLIELMVVLAISAVLVSLALPSLGGQMARHRLKAAAETLAADMAEARFEATRRGHALHLQFAQGADWCYAVATASGCDCRVTQPCQLKTVRSSDHPGVLMTQADDALLDPAGSVAPGKGSAVLRSARGDELRVELTRLGRVRLCAPESAALGVARC